MRGQSVKRENILLFINNLFAQVNTKTQANTSVFRFQQGSEEIFKFP